MDGPSAEPQIRRKISSGPQDNRSREVSHGMTISRPTGAQPAHCDASLGQRHCTVGETEVGIENARS